MKTYSEVEDYTRSVIIKCGGSLSHHHGIGKLRKHFMNEAVGDTNILMLKGLQKAIDPQGVMNNGNLV